MHVEGVLQEHVARASELLALIRSPSFEFRDGEVANDMWRRYDANLDALRIAGEPAIVIAEAAMKDDVDAASVVALLLADSDHDDNDAGERAQRAVSLLRHESPETRQAAWFGLRLATSTHTHRCLAALARGPVWDFASAAALDILAFHRQPTPVPLELSDPPQDSAEIAWLLAEAAGRIPGAWSATHLERFLDHPSRRVREAALRASARCGHDELLAICRSAADHATEQAASLEAIEFLGVVGSHEDLPRLRRAASTPATAKSGVIALGRLGLVGAMPTLLYLLDEPELVEIAASAITRITGEDLPRGTAPPPPSGLSEDDLDLWEPVAPVDATRAREWWATRAPHVDPAKRYQSGVCVSDDPVGPAFDRMSLAIHRDLYLRQRALLAGTPDWELETWPWRHKSPHELSRPSRLTN
jgi:hypothetical protein